MYYFGCNGRPGHYLFDHTLHMISRTPRGFPLSRYEILDGGLFPCGTDSGGPEGVVVAWRNSGWAIFSFLDRSVDTRPACNSSFIVKIADDECPEETLLRACKAFPSIVTRFTFPLVMDGKQVWPVKVDQPTLLPCPFCGGEATESAFGKPAYDVGNSWVPGVAEAVVRCKDCGAGVTCNLSLGSADGTDKDALAVLARARGSWNARAVSSS